MLISIVIRCRNEAQAIGGTLEKIFTQTVDIPYEVVVVDSGSTDGTIEIVRRYPVRLFEIPQESFTFGYALNYGIEKSEGSVIVNISAHCLPVDTHWLSELIKPILEGEADAVYGRQVAVRGLNPFEEMSLHKHFPETEKVDGRRPFSNANCAFLKRMWEDVRFDEDLPSWEDYLWYLLLKDKSRFRYCPKAAVFHTHRFSLSAIKRRSFNDGKAFRMFKERYGIDLIAAACPTVTAKGKLFLEDIRGHMRFFKKEGYPTYFLCAPIVRLLAFKAYRDGYRSTKCN